MVQDWHLVMNINLARIVAAGRALAYARRNGVVTQTALLELTSDEDAEAVQLGAIEAMGDQPAGYSTLTFREQIAPSRQTESFVHGLLIACAIHETGATYRVPQGLLGARPALFFTLGRPYPEEEEITRETAMSAILTCELAIELLGRRVPGSMPLTARTAMADFALHVATFRSTPLLHWPNVFWSDESIVLSIDGHPVQKISCAAFFERCLDSVNSLADALAHAGRRLNAGDRVSTGWGLPALQVLAGQHLRIDFPG
jgi:2-keto-4-pentenoate hydratase